MGIDASQSIQGTSSFSDNDGYIIFTLQQRPDLRQPKPDAIKIDVWSHKDTIIQSTQSYLQKKPKTYWAIIGTEGGRLIHLQSDYQSWKGLKGDFAVIAKTGSQINGDRFWEADYRVDSNWLLSLKDGTRKLLKTRGDETQTHFWFSPDGNYLVYFDLEEQCNYFSYNLRTGKLVKISAGIPAWELGMGGEYIRPSKPIWRVGIAGWLKGEDGLLVYSNYDIWQLDLEGKKAPINITNGYGRSHHIQLRLAARTNTFDNVGDVPILAQKDSLLLNATNMLNKHNGFYRKVLGTIAPLELLYMGPCVLEMTVESDGDHGMRPIRAANTNTWIVKRQTATEAPNYFLTSDFKGFKPLTDLQPQKGYNWLTAELVNFKQLDGTMSQGVLYKPENFDPTKKYPVIIGFYEQFSNFLYEYREPEYLESPYIEVPWLVSHGYLVFLPDIYFTKGKWGPSTVNTIDGAAKYLNKLPFVDGKHMAATGHSNSGRFGSYLLTHSRSFAAMSVGSGTTDLISQALSLYDPGKGHKEESLLGWAEVEAVGTGLGNLWKNKDLWLKQTSVLSADKVVSPVLFFYCKGDGTGDRQGVEMFIALRRLEKKAWWLQYDDGKHTVSGKDSKDFTIRYTQFMDHYLKGAPAPCWMTEGIPAKLKGIESRYELDPEGSCGNNCPVCKKLHTNKTDNTKLSSTLKTQ
ncbi:MAG: S9 family peptidase [Sphingobacteriales bacterium]